MSGLLQHPPAEIVQALLALLGVGVVPPTAGQWPIYSPTEPDSPDNVMTIGNTAGRDDGSNHVTGEHTIHHGVQIRVRSSTSSVGFVQANAVLVALNKYSSNVQVVIDSATYLVQKVSTVGDVIPLGKEAPTSQRFLFTLNALVSVRMIGA